MGRLLILQWDDQGSIVRTPYDEQRLALAAAQPRRIRLAEFKLCTGWRDSGSFFVLVVTDVAFDDGVVEHQRKDIQWKRDKS